MLVSIPAPVEDPTSLEHYLEGKGVYVPEEVVIPVNEVTGEILNPIGEGRMCLWFIGVLLVASTRVC
jgi:hypothetical protein